MYNQEYSKIFDLHTAELYDTLVYRKIISTC